jgi:hypothetical protein
MNGSSPLTPAFEVLRLRRPSRLFRLCGEGFFSVDWRLYRVNESAASILRSFSRGARVDEVVDALQSPAGPGSRGRGDAIRSFVAELVSLGILEIGRTRSPRWIVPGPLRVFPPPELLLVSGGRRSPPSLTVVGGRPDVLHCPAQGKERDG